MAIGIVALASIPLHLLLYNHNSKTSSATQDAYKKLKAEREKQLKEYDATVSMLTDSIATLNEQLTYSESKLTEIKNKRNEKTLRINKLTTDELSRAITNNYKERIID